MVQMIAQVSIGKSSNIFANYELADKFQDFTLGGKLSHNSLSIYPREINDTDNFWFEFQTTVGKEYYYVMPAAGKSVNLYLTKGRWLCS